MNINLLCSVHVRMAQIPTSGILNLFLLEGLFVQPSNVSNAEQ